MKLPQKYISLSSIIWVLKQKRFLQYNQIYHLSSSYHEDEDKSKQKKRYEQYSSWASLFCWQRIAFSPLSSAYVALDHRHGKDEIAHNSQDDLEREKKMPQFHFAPFIQNGTENAKEKMRIDE